MSMTTITNGATDAVKDQFNDWLDWTISAGTTIAYVISGELIGFAYAGAISLVLLIVVVGHSQARKHRPPPYDWPTWVRALITRSTD